MSEHPHDHTGHSGQADPGAGQAGHQPGFHGLGRSEITLPEEMISVEQYRQFVAERIRMHDPIELRLPDALGLVLAEPVVSPEAVPSFANSAMDGYAVVASDVAEASQDSPVVLRVVGDIPAGAQTLPTVKPGQAASIMTGAPLPPGADAVVPVEVTSGSGSEIWVHRRSISGEFVRTVGQDVQPGQKLLQAGHRLGPADIGLLAAVGVPHVQCYAPARVVILSTGDELVPWLEQPGPGQIRNSNSPMLAAMVRQAGAVPFTAEIARDDRRAIMSALDGSVGHADMFIVTGGVSAGAYDHVRDAIGALGEVHSFKVAMKPGMPQVFGQIAHVPVFGLPGNPVSSFVSFEVFVRPVLRRIAGRRDQLRPIVRAIAGEPLRSPPNKRTFLRVRLKREDRKWIAAGAGHQGSHVLSALARADGLAEIPEDVTELPAGERVNVHLLVDM